MKKFLVLLNGNFDICAVADYSCESARQLMLRLFRYYMEHSRQCRIDYTITSFNMLNDPDYYHLGLLGGNANVFMCTKSILKILRNFDIRKYNLVAIPNESLFPDVLRNPEDGMVGSFVSMYRI